MLTGVADGKKISIEGARRENLGSGTFIDLRPQLVLL